MIKQVIVMRTDTDPKMRKGKMVAQGSHASMAFLSKRIQKQAETGSLELTDDMMSWLNGTFTKICVSVDSLHELHAIHDRATALGIESHIITDCGLTEFKGPTETCLALGPCKAELIDQVTGHLKLL